MDVVFDAVDAALDRVRRRLPATLLGVGGVLWVLATAVFTWVALTEGNLGSGAALTVLPGTLLVMVAVRGLDRLRRPIWPLGVAPLVVLAGLMIPSVPPSQPIEMVIPVVAFLYAQLFLAVVAAADELHRRRATRAGEQRPAMTAIGRRRLLQTKILLATLVVLVLSQTAGDRISLENRVADQPGQATFEFLFSCFSIPMFVGIWWRRRGLAWYAAIALPAVFALSLLPRPPEALGEVILTQGWIIVAATWQWLKAARAPFWPHPPRPPRPPHEAWQQRPPQGWPQPPAQSWPQAPTRSWPQPPAQPWTPPPAQPWTPPSPPSPWQPPPPQPWPPGFPPSSPPGKDPG
ncbi:hypothetical protein [Actinoplanes sp. NPDC023714]|uniref:hypothetical protein n=1 Tax=Actinoplanes sp. NPDC023714 TaxID=3154322 RepID=UPI003403C078